MATTTSTSQQFTLNISDLWKGLLMAILAPAVTILYDLITTGNAINWQHIGAAALAGGLGYLIKNFLTPSAIVIKDAPPSQVQAVKDGAAEAKVVSK